MALVSDLIDRSEFEAQFKALAGTRSERVIGTHTWNKLVQCVEQNGATDPDTGADWVALSQANLDANFRVGLKSREDFEVLLLQAMVNSAVHVP